MPVKSSKQWRFMQVARKKGIGGLSKGKASEFIRKTPKKKRSMFARGKD